MYVPQKIIPQNPPRLIGKPQSQSTRLSPALQNLGLWRPGETSLPHSRHLHNSTSPSYSVHKSYLIPHISYRIYARPYPAYFIFSLMSGAGHHYCTIVGWRSIFPILYPTLRCVQLCWYTLPFLNLTFLNLTFLRTRVDPFGGTRTSSSDMIFIVCTASIGLMLVSYREDCLIFMDVRVDARHKGTYVGHNNLNVIYQTTSTLSTVSSVVLKVSRVAVASTKVLLIGPLIARLFSSGLGHWSEILQDDFTLQQSALLFFKGVVWVFQ